MPNNTRPAYYNFIILNKKGIVVGSHNVKEIGQVAKEYGTSVTHICKVFSGLQKTSGGHKFKKVEAKSLSNNLRVETFYDHPTIESPFGGKISISNFGRIKFDKYNITKGYKGIETTGYFYRRIGINGKQYLVHRLLRECWLGRELKTHEFVCHKTYLDGRHRDDEGCHRNWLCDLRVDTNAGNHNDEAKQVIIKEVPEEYEGKTIEHGAQTYTLNVGQIVTCAALAKLTGVSTDYFNAAANPNHTRRKCAGFVIEYV